MKVAVLSFIFLLSFHLISAQVPQGFSFQGIVFDDAGEPLEDADISVRIEIIDEDINGPSIYSELHDVVTSSQGLYTLSVGMGNTEFGQFSDITWLENSKFIKVSIEDEGNGEYEIIGTNQFLSVPYALAAGSAPVESKIFVKPPFDKSKLIAKNGVNYDGQGSIKYVYQWVDGAPEDVFIEVSGLPDNMAIYTNARGGFGLSQVIKNTSHVDTIVDGIFKPQSFIGLDDKNVMVAPGVYPLDLTFKTKSKVLNTITDTLYIYGISYEDCFAELPSTFTLESVSCAEMQELFSDQVVIDELTLTSVSITDLIVGYNGNSNINFPQDAGCDQYSSNIDLPSVIDNKFLELESFEYIGSELHYNLKFEDVFNGDESFCTIIYSQ